MRRAYWQIYFNSGGNDLNWKDLRVRVAEGLALSIGGKPYREYRVASAAFTAHCLRSYSPDQTARIVYEFIKGTPAPDNLGKVAQEFDKWEEKNVSRG